jgi:hypothetical protein
MQTNYSRRTLPGLRDFRIDRARFRAERKNWKDAFSITHEGGAVTYSLSPQPKKESVRDNRVAQFRKSFFAAKTIAQLIVEQGIRPVQDIASLAGAIPDEDLDEFVADIYRGRKD